MKKVLFLISIIGFFIFTVKSQTIIGTQNFDGAMNWSVSPASSWVPNAIYAVSNPNSYHGFVPNQLHDSITITTPFYDCSAYAFVWLSFHHICKLAGSDIAQIEIQENTTGAKWEKLPSSCYLGSNPSAYNQQRFNHFSYADWQPSDSLATPTNAWWKEERFDISGEASFGIVRFRFKIIRGNVIGTQFAYGWLIDNFELRGGSHELDPPVLTLINPIYKDTVYGVGPFNIVANVVDAEDSLIGLTYSINHGFPNQVRMNKIDANLYAYPISQQVYGTQVDYTVRAEDSVGNSVNVAYTFINKRHPNSPNFLNGAAMLAIDTPHIMKVVANQSMPVYVRIKNTGLNPLNSTDIYWSVNGVVQPSYHWSGGNLPVDFASNPIYIGNYTPNLGYDTLLVWVKNPNAVTDSLETDDTLSYITYGCNTIFNGEYTIGGPAGSNNFNSISAALNELNVCGMSGNTIFKIYNGTYTDNIHINAAIEGMGAFDTLTFMSASGNADSVIIQSSDVAVQLGNVNNIVFKNLSIDVTTGSKGIEFTGPCENIEINSCVIKTNPTTNSSTHACIYKASGRGVHHNIRIINNILDGGYYNIYLYGGTSSTVRGSHIIFSGNALSNAYYYATYFYYADFDQLSDNIIRSRTTNTYSNFYGLRMYYCDAPSISRNKIYVPAPISNVYGMYIGYCNNSSTAAPVVLSNNEIRIKSSTSSYALYIISSRMEVVHNSILALELSNATNIGIYISSSTDLQVRNNNLVTAVPIYFTNLNSLGNTWFFDYNNYYSHLGYIGYATSTITSMSSWRSTTGQDANSVSVYPNFVDTSVNLKTSGGSIICQSHPHVPTDMNGIARGLMTTMGAYHDFILKVNNVMPYHIYSPSDLSTVSGNDSVVVSVLNIGSNTVTSMKINWKVNGVLMTQYAWSGSLSPGDTTQPIKLGNFMASPGDNQIIVYTSFPNNQADQDPTNDTIKTETYGCDSLMSGTYTIGTSGNFATIADALHRIKSCGISGPVTFAIFPGLYIENIILDDTIRGCNATNTISFTSTTGIKEDVIIYTALDSAQDIGTIDLKNVKHLLFKNIAIYGQHRSPMYYSKAVVLRNGAENIEFNNCILLIPTFVSATNIPNQLSVVFSPSANPVNNIRILNSIIHGGSAGIYLMGGGENVSIKNNDIINVDFYGMYLNYVNFNEVSNNYIEQRYNANLTLVDFYGMYLNRSNGNFLRNNKLYIYQTYYGMYFYYASKKDSNYLYVYNNEIIAKVSGSNYGMYVSTGSNYIKFLHNSMLISGNGEGKCFYVSSSLNNNVLKNNNFINLSNDVYSIYNHVMYFPSLTYTSGFMMDYNNYFTIGSYLAYAGNNITNLTLWKTAVGQDGNSKSINPTFFNPQTLNIVDYSGLDCPRLPDVLTDIDSNIRTPNTTVGAYHGDPYPLDIMPRTLLSPTKVSQIGTSTAVSITVLNVGTDTITNLQIHWEVNGTLQTPYHWTGILLPNTTTSPITLGYFNPQAENNSIIVYTSLPNGQADNLPTNDTLVFNTFGCGSGYSGTYTVGLYGNDFNSLNEAIEALSYCGVYGPTTISVNAGTYRGNLIIPNIPGASAVNTITITSTNRDSSSVIIQATSASGVIILDNTKHITISHLTLEGILSGSASRCVEFKNKNKDILITNNYMHTCPSIYASPAIMAIISDNSQDTNIIIRNNHLFGTGGIWIESANQASSASYNITIENNIIENFYYYGIYMYYSGINKVHHNTLYKSNASNQGYGIYMYYCNGVMDDITKITSNTFIGEYAYVAYMNYCYSHGGLASSDILFANNELIQTGTGCNYLIYQNYGGKWQNINNSLINTGTTSYMIYRNTSSTESVNLINNIIANLGSCSYLVYCNTATSTYIGSVDYNNYWKGNANAVAYWGGTAYNDLLLWQSAYPTLNIHSVTLHPKCKDSTLNAIPSIWNGLECPSHYLATNDIRGIDRSLSTHMGCYVPIYDLDAGLKAFVSPQGNATVTQTNVTVSLTNWGYDTLHSINIHWKIDSVLGTPLNLTGLNLPQYKDTNILIGSYLPSLGNITHLTAWVDKPNGKTDQNTFNDTISTQSLGCNRILYGTYTVGGVGADFVDLAQVLLELNTCGIAGNVSFLLQNGIYTENLDFTHHIPGMTANDTLTFASLSGNADSVTIVSFDTAVLFGNVNNIVLHHLSFDLTQGSYAILFKDACENIEINHCHIKCDTTSTRYAGIYKEASSGVVHNIRILHNNIDGACYNIYFEGGLNTSEFANNIIINDNVLSNAYERGAYLYYSNFNSISNNSIHTRKTNTSSLYYGLSICYSNVSAIHANKIYSHEPFNEIYGMYVNYVNYYNAVSTGLISNNEINLQAKSSDAYGMYVNYSKVNIYHNSIHLTASAAAKGLYANTNINYPIAIRQNNIGTYSNLVYPMYLPSFNGLTLNYNNYYGSYIGFITSGISNLALWKMTSGQDVHSTNINPGFVDFPNSLKTDGMGLTCNQIKDVLSDINGNTRGIITSVGAYNDFIILPYNVMPHTLVSPMNQVSAGMSDSVFVRVANMGSNVINAMSIHLKINGVLIQSLPWTGNLNVMEVSAPIYLGNFVALSGSNTLMIYTELPNGQTDNDLSNDTLRVEVYGCDSTLSGHYYVGGSGADYTSISEAIKALSYCGISSPTTLYINAGTYVENVYIPSIPGTNSTHTLTLTSANGDSSSVIIQSPSEKAAISLSNTNNIILRNLTVNAILSGQNSNAIELKNSNKNILITHNCIQTSTDTSASEALMAIYSNNSLDTSLVITYNYFHGSGGIWIQSASNNYSSYDISITHNILNQFHYYGIYIAYSNVNTISNNKLYKNPSQGGYGLYINYSNGVMSDITRIINNTIVGNFTTLAYLNYCFSNHGTTVADILLANNEFIQKGNGTYMVYQSYGGKWQNINNTLLATSNASISYMMYKYSTVSNGINIINNLFVNLGNASYLLYVPTSSYAGTVDYNNYYTSGTDFVYWGTSYSGLHEWQNAYPSLNMHSNTVNPGFAQTEISAEPLSWVGLICPRNPLILRDIKGITRGQNTYMGCYVPSFNFDAGLETFVSPPQSAIAGTPTPVSINISNSGTTILQSLRIQWKVNNNTMTAVNISGLALAQYQDTVIVIGNYIPINNVNANIKAWIELPNGQAMDDNQANDTIETTSLGCNQVLNGTYLVGSSSADFQTLNDAFQVLTSCGVSGPVVLQMLPGTYNGFSINQSFIGCNQSHTVTITSSTGIASDVVFQSSGVVLNLANTSDLVFTHITLDASSGTRAIQLGNACENIEINQCVIKANPTASSTTYAGIYKSSTGIVNNIRILHNRIDGGYYNIYFYGGDGTSDYGTNIIINGNMLSNAYYYGGYFYYTDFISLSDNIVSSRLSNTYNYFYGLYSVYCNVESLSGNKIRSFNPSINYPYGIYLNYVNYNNTHTSGLIANNDIILNANSTSSAIYVSNSRVNIMHNSVWMDGSGANRLIYLNPIEDYMVKVKNNNLVTTSTSGYALYLSNTNYVGTSLFMDYNNYYAAYIGYANGNVANLSVWRTTTQQDAHSVSLLPKFVDVSKDLRLTDYIGLMCPRDTLVLTDMDKKARTSLTVIGAYSVALYEDYDLSAAYLVEPVNAIGGCYPDYTSVKIALSNNGIFPFNFALTPLHLHVEISGNILYQHDTIISAGTLAEMQQDTFEIARMIPVHINGDYHIRAYLSCSVDTIHSDDSLQYTYHVNKAYLPLDIDFSTSPTEMTFHNLTGSLNWEVMAGNESSPPISPVFGSGRLRFASASGKGSMAQAITQPLDLQGTYSPTLEFWYAHDNSAPDARDQINVYVSTDGGITYTSLINVFRYDSNFKTPTWKYYRVDLSAYSNQSCVVFAFEAQSYGGNNQNIDRIRIAAAPDIKISEILVPDLQDCDFMNKSLKLIISNNTSQTFDFSHNNTHLNVNLTYPTGPSFDTTYILNTKVLLGGQSDTLVIVNNYDFNIHGSYRLLTFINSVDSNSLNDTLRKTIEINPDIAITYIRDISPKSTGDTVYASAWVKNAGSPKVTQVPLRLKINNANDITETLNASLLPGDSIYYTFKKGFIVPEANLIQPYYQLSIQSELACDVVAANNMKFINARIIVNDIAVTKIEKPTEEDCDTGFHFVYTAVELTNHGDSDVVGVRLIVHIDSGNVRVKELGRTVTVYAKSAETFAFSTPYKVPNIEDSNETYRVTAFINAVEKDIDPLNDTLRIEACVVYNPGFGINTYTENQWYVEQNQPNPALTSTVIPYYVPQDGEIRCILSSVKGQVLYQEVQQAEAGKNEFYLPTNHLSNGIYYYSLTYKGKTIVRKMNVQR